jgi:hypothetical protein
MPPCQGLCGKPADLHGIAEPCLKFKLAGDGGDNGVMSIMLIETLRSCRSGRGPPAFSEDERLLLTIVDVRSAANRC